MGKQLPKDVKARLEALKHGNSTTNENGQPVHDTTKGHMPGPTQAKTQKTHQNRGSSGK
ncbi:MAG TPA: hypothetical protein VGE01_02195 [Fimbriimonas sp.]